MRSSVEANKAARDANKAARKALSPEVREVMKANRSEAREAAKPPPMPRLKSAGWWGFSREARKAAKMAARDATREALREAFLPRA